MRIKLYSEGHLEAAYKLFPERFEDSEWLDLQWTDEEINACKALESKEFIKDPSPLNYPWELLDPLDSLFKDNSIGMVDKYLRNRPEVKRLLSVGCGGGEKEYWLARRHPGVKITAVDIAPYIEALNTLAESLGVLNIRFKKLDLRGSDFDQFDLVYSNAVIYCLQDEELRSYFQTLANHTGPKGLIIVSTAANISLLFKLVRFLGGGKHKRYWKQTGWMRDWNGIKRFLSLDCELEKLEYYNHDGHIPLKMKLPMFAKLVYLFSRNVYPISNSGFGIFLRKRDIL